MSGLNCKTRNNTSPNGKPRVYFCCHPDDRKTYFSQIAQDLLRHQDCAVWYNTAPSEAPDVDFWCDLEQMHLFVIPVTARFLGGDHRGLAEFHFAKEKNIPVLPLMQETGLAERFNAVCGDLQFLDKSNTDATAIGFDEKLKKYLSSVLIGDELAEKIRGAFDAYIFLSYRKKDRRHAQTLMRLIHQNPFCRDIAIWYDEFLTPGENFNEAILAALKKSGLFVLAVTPNLVNETNYVMTTEYPLAIEKKKPILPVELVETDRALLNEHYPELPALTDAYADAELAAVLAKSLQKIAIAKRVKDARHNYFIGLAYLGGIDVEANGAKAEELLTSAAEEGLEEAMEQLCSMYRHGNGVKRSGPRAVEWQNRLVEAVKCRYESHPAQETLLRYTEVLSDLGDLLCEELRTEEAEAAYLTMTRLCGEDEPTDPALLHRLADAHLALGGLSVNRKKEHYDKEVSFESGGYVITLSHMHRETYQWEEQHYSRAAELYERLIQTDSSDEVLIQLCRCNIHLGKLNRSKHHLGCANEYFQQVITHCRNKGGIFRMLLAETYGGLGDLWREYARNESLKAEFRQNSYRCYWSAFQTMIALYRETPSPSISRETVQASRNLGKWFLEEKLAKDPIPKEKWFSFAEQCYHQAEVIARKLAEKTDSPADKALLGQCLLDWGKLWLESPEKDYSKAEPLLLKALELFEAQFNQTDIFDVRYDAFQCNRTLSRLYEALGDQQKAVQYEQQADELSNCATRWEGSNEVPIALDPTLPYFNEYLTPSDPKEDGDDH